jgi:hypothetical protein
VDDNYVSLANYCKKKRLSIPKDFSDKQIAENCGKENLQVKESLYFKERYLDKAIPRLGFSKIKPRASTTKNIKVFKLVALFIIVLEEEHKTDAEDKFYAVLGNKPQLEKSVALKESTKIFNGIKDFVINSNHCLRDEEDALQEAMSNSKVKFFVCDKKIADIISKA